MPKLSEAMETGKLLRWLKQEGDRVAGGDIIAEIETDKADIELEAFGSAVKAPVDPGATVPVGSTIAVIADPGEDISAILGSSGAPAAAAPAREPARSAPASPSAQATAAATVPTAPSPSAADVRRAPAQAPVAAAPTAAAPTPAPADDEEAEEPPVAGRRLRASPSAKKLAQKAGVDLAVIQGTGPGGRIIQRDVEAATATRPAAVAVPATPAARPEGESEDQPLSQYRAAIARQMVQSKAPFLHFDADGLEIAMDRAALLEQLQACLARRARSPTWSSARVR